MFSVSLISSDWTCCVCEFYLMLYFSLSFVSAVVVVKNFVVVVLLFSLKIFLLHL